MKIKTMTLPKMVRFKILKPEIRGYLGTSLAEFFVSPAHRWLVYAVTFILSGVMSFGALWLFDTHYGIDFYEDIPLTFKGMYTWHTAANFALCLLVVDLLLAYGFRSWGAYERRTVGRTWIIFLITFPLGFLLQRTLIYQLVDLYYPVLLVRHDTYPSERPDALSMFFYMLPFWLIIGQIVIRLIIGMQARSEELLRVRIDTILEERAGQGRQRSLEAHTAPDADEHIQLPFDSDVGPVMRSQIGHVTAEDHYLRIYFRINGTCKETLIRMSLKALAARLPDDQFIRIHRSHIVNLLWISGVKRAGREVRLIMKHGASDLPVSRYRLPQLLPVLDQFLDRSPRPVAPST